MNNKIGLFVFAALFVGGCDSYKETLIYKDCIDACKDNTGLICLGIADKLPDICKKKAQQCVEQYGSTPSCDNAFSEEQKEKREAREEFEKKMDKHQQELQSISNIWKCKSKCFDQRRECIEQKPCHIDCINTCNASQAKCTATCE